MRHSTRELLEDNKGNRWHPASFHAWIYSFHSFVLFFLLSFSMVCLLGDWGRGDRKRTPSRISSLSLLLRAEKLIYLRSRALLLFSLPSWNEDYTHPKKSKSKKKVQWILSLWKKGVFTTCSAESPGITNDKSERWLFCSLCVTHLSSPSLHLLNWRGGWVIVVIGIGTVPFLRKYRNRECPLHFYNLAVHNQYVIKINRIAFIYIPITDPSVLYNSMFWFVSVTLP